MELGMALITVPEMQLYCFVIVGNEEEVISLI